MSSRNAEIFQLLNFDAGAVEKWNPELGVEDQANLLPYDQKWEVPKKNIKLGKFRECCSCESFPLVLSFKNCVYNADVRFRFVNSKYI